MHVLYLEMEVPEAHVVCQDVQHAHHLGENEDAMSGLVETHQQLVQQVQLATSTNQSLWRARDMSYTPNGAHHTLNNAHHTLNSSTSL